MVAPLTISSERSRVVDFSRPFKQVGLQVAVQRITAGEPGTFQFLDPLSTATWVVIFVLGVATSIALSLINAWSPYSYRNARLLRKEPPKCKTDCAIDEFSLYNALWFVVGSFAQQGADKQPLSPSGRMLITTWYLFALVVINTYIANLAAVLTSTNRNTEITGISSLASQAEFNYGTVRSSQPESFLSTSQVFAYQLVWASINGNMSQLVDTVEEGLMRVRTSAYAFIWDEPALRFASQRLPCDIDIRGKSVVLGGYGLAMPRGSPFRNEVSKAVLDLQENGIIHQLEELWWEQRTQCGANAATQSGYEVITLSHVSGLIYVVVVGIACSFLFLLGEVLYYSWRQSKKEKVRLKRSCACHFTASELCDYVLIPRHPCVYSYHKVRGISPPSLCTALVLKWGGGGHLPRTSRKL